MRTVLLAGGTGGAKLACGLAEVVGARNLTVVANTADDDEFWGLLVSPDVDATLYRLAGVFNEQSGWGVRDETFNTLAALRALGEATWFQLGDHDLATHIFRAEMLRRGCRPTEAALELGRRLGVASPVLPMTDARVRTRFDTEAGTFSFQEYFVRERLGPRLRGVEFEGIDDAKASPEVVGALQDAELVVIGPSNPVISIGPILRLVAPHLDRERTLAVTPIVGGAALKGPTVEMMLALASEPTPVGVAKEYRNVAGRFVLDIRDEGLEPAISALGYRVSVCDTVMDDGGRRLAEAITR